MYHVTTPSFGSQPISDEKAGSKPIRSEDFEKGPFELVSLRTTLYTAGQTLRLNFTYVPSIQRQITLLIQVVQYDMQVGRRQTSAQWYS